MRHLAKSLVTTTLLVGLFAASPTFAAEQQGYMQSGSAVQAEEQQQTGAVGQQQQISAQDLTSEQVRTLQQSLQENGVDSGPIDGIMGSRTGQALREFQQEKGLAATGQLSRQTLEALHLQVEEFMGVAPEFGMGQENKVEQQALHIERQGALQDDRK